MRQRTSDLFKFWCKKAIRNQSDKRVGTVIKPELRGGEIFLLINWGSFRWWHHVNDIERIDN